MSSTACHHFLLCLCVCVAVVPTALLEDDTLNAIRPGAVCDNGKVGGDIGDLQGWKCQGNHYQITKLENQQSSHHEECHATVEESTALCMTTPIVYDHHPPSSGNYRLQRPKYGEYDQLPPQRWLGALKYGAVVFLYHPCTPPEQVAQLRQLAQSCLWRHFISPYPHLDSEWPMAVVSWGCVLRIRWVEVESLREWISSHALHTPLAAEVSTDGDYEDGLLNNAARVEVDGKEVVCPKLRSPTLPHLPTSTLYIEKRTDTKRSAVLCPTPATHRHSVNHSSPGENQSSCLLPPSPTCCAVNPDGSNLLHGHVGYTILIAIASVVLLSALVVFTWNLLSRGGRRRSRARYKSVSKFFPFSYGQQLDGNEEGVVSVAMPEYGLPKSGQAEREMLLNESDEDEI